MHIRAFHLRISADALPPFILRSLNGTSVVQSILMIMCRGGDSNDVTPMLHENMVSRKRYLRRSVSGYAPHVGVSD
jgi:ribosomal protein S6E (S10)